MGHSHNTMIFSTDAGIVALDSPVKLKILELLSQGTTSFDELVEQSGKAKSTISVHLDDLEKLNLIQEKNYPDDKRKKYFVLNSMCMAFSQRPLRNQYNRYLDNIGISELNDSSFIKHLFYTVRYGIEAYGVDPKPLMKIIGNDIGTRIGPGFKPDNLEGILDELIAFWNYHEMGNMSVVRDDKLIILIDNCSNMDKMPSLGKTLCSISEGIIEGILSSRLNLNYDIMETECFGTGHNRCKFVVEVK